MARRGLLDRRVVALTLAVDRVTAEAWTKLAQKGIPAILLKGPSIAAWLYGPAGRGYGDADVLVDPSHLESARAVLSRLGFERQRASIPGDRPPASEPWLRHSDRGTVDLHWSLNGLQSAPDVVWRTLSHHVEVMEVAGTRVTVLSIPARAMHVALHALEPAPGRAKALEDLQRAVAHEPLETWTQAVSIARELGAATAFAQGLRLVPAGTEIAERLGLPRGSPREVALRARGGPPAALTIEWLASLSSLRSRLGLLARKLFPPPAFMRYWSPLARRNRVGLALAYLWRPAWVAWRAGPAFVEWMRVRRSPRDDTTDSAP